MSRKHLLFCYLLVFQALFALSILNSKAIEVVNNLSFDLFSQEHGLSNNQIHCVLQDSKGWMWIGTSQGVCRFDGYRFTVFKNDPDDSTSLKGNLVRVIYEDSKGQLYIGTEDGGLNKFDKEKETFQHIFYHGDSAPLKDVSVTSIMEDHDGNLWVGTETNLYRIEKGNKLTTIKPANLQDFSEYFRVIRTDYSGKIWIGTNRGAYIYHPQTNQAEQLKLPENFSNDEIWEILSDQDGTVLVGTYTFGLFKVNAASLEVKSIPIDPENDRSRTVRAITKDPNGKFWIGTRGGLYLYDNLKGVIAKYFHDDREQKSLVNNSVLCISKDAKGNLWIGTRQGLNLKIDERDKQET